MKLSAKIATLFTMTAALFITAFLVVSSAQAYKFTSSIPGFDFILSEDGYPSSKGKLAHGAVLFLILSVFGISVCKI